MRGQQGECGAAREGCRSARACATLSPPRWTTRASAAAQGRTQRTAAAALVHLHPQNAHSSALLARWAGPTSTAVTARSGAPFAQTVSLFLQRALSSRRIPAPTGAITRSPAQRRKILSSPSYILRSRYIHARKWSLSYIHTYTQGNGRSRQQVQGKEPTHPRRFHTTCCCGAGGGATLFQGDAARDEARE